MTAAWHELDKTAPETGKALTFLHTAIDLLTRAEDALLSAAEEVDNTPECDRIMSLMRSVEDLECDIRMQEMRLKE